MACNSCAKPFTLFRKEKGCPGCGFTYCNNCLVSKIFLKKLNQEAKVCSKCKNMSGKDEKKIIQAPDAYNKRIGALSDAESSISGEINKTNSTEEEIRKRLQTLKQDKEETKRATDEDISKRLQSIKDPHPTTSDAELQQRLAKLKDIPNIGVQSKPILCPPDTRTEQEQANDLMKQYLEQVNIDTQYQEGFSRQINEIETRMQKLRGSPVSSEPKPSATQEEESEDEETAIKKILEKIKAESSLQDDYGIHATDELPFCEICNEDATLRCLGCRYLFCKRCFNEHKDDDDGCNRYEPYKPPKQL